MTIQFYLDGNLLGAGRVRVDAQLGLTSAADSGALGTGVIEIDDPDGTLTVTGWMPFHVVETQCSEQRVWTGYIYERAIARGRPEHVLSTARTYVCTLLDLNANLNLRVFTQDAAKRPLETDVTRVAWMLTQTQATENSLINDNGLVSTANAGNFDEADYRGQYPLDLLESVAASSVKNFYMYWDSSAAEASLFYDKPDAAVRTSTLRISNVDADVDESVTFSPINEVVLTRDPSSVYSGVWYGWRGGNLYTENSTTESNFIARDAVYSTERIGRLATAQTQSAAWLQVRSNEQDRITCRVRLPVDKVNLILAGQRLQVKFSHLPAYTSFTYVRVVRRTVQITGQQDPREYEVELELSNGTPTPAAGGAPGSFPATQTVATSTSWTSLQLTWSGGTINAEPAGWRDAGFDDSAWETGYIPPDPPGGWADIPGADFLSNLAARTGPFLDGAVWIARYEFTLAAPPTSDVTLTYNCDNTIQAWLNDTQIIAAGTGLFHTAFTASIAKGLFVAGANCLAFKITNVAVGDNTWSDPTMVQAIMTVPPSSAPAPGQPVNGVAPSETPDGTSSTFTSPFPYANGSLRVQVQGIDVTNFAVTELDPTAGTFRLDFAPLASETVTIYFVGR